MSERTSVGGQAVLEGVMMRSPNCLSVAVRRPNGEIVVRENVWHSIWNKLRFLRWPFLRGTVVMIEAMVNGIQALNFSARESMTEEEKEKEENNKVGSLSVGISVAITVVIVIALFKLLPHLAATYIGEMFLGRPPTVNELFYHVVDGIVKVLIFIAYVASIGLIKDIARVFMYHGAEHMAIHTFEEDEELTVENARSKSPLHLRCGTSFIMVVIIVFIAVAALLMPFLPEWSKPVSGGPWYRHLLIVLFKLPLLLPVAGVAYEFNRFAGRHAGFWLLKPLMWPGLAVQFLTTRQPTDEQLEIAIVALKTALSRECDTKKPVPVLSEPAVYPNFEVFLHLTSNGLRPAEGKS